MKLVVGVRRNAGSRADPVAGNHRLHKEVVTMSDPSQEQRDPGAYEALRAAPVAMPLGSLRFSTSGSKRIDTWLGCTYEQAETDYWECLALQFETCLRDEPKRLDEFQRLLGLPANALLSLGVGWDPKGQCWTFPMRNRLGDACGIQRRFRKGEPRAMAGSHLGCFGLPVDDLQLFADRGIPLVVCEGASDTGAAMALGLQAVGRACAQPGREADAGALEACRGRQVILVPDNDKAGLDGAAEFTPALLRVARSVRCVVPKGKDLRADYLAGLTRQEFIAKINGTPPFRFDVEIA